MGGGHEPKHFGGTTAPPTPKRRPWRRSLAVGGMALALVGTAAIVRGTGDHPGAAPTAPAAKTDGEAAAQDIAVCVRSSLDDRAGRTLVLGLPGVTRPDDPMIARFAAAHVGGVMLRDDNIEDEDQARDLIEGLRAQLGEHVLVAIDDEGGRVSALGALGESVPPARRLGTRGADAAREAGEELGTLASSIGIDWVLAPVTDLDDGPAGGVIGDRSFGGDADQVITAAGAFIAGAKDAGLAVTLKHFPGDGGDGDPHTGETQSDATLDDLQGADLAAFRALMPQADAVMVGHVEYPKIWSDDRPASLQPDAYRLLRSTDFDGLAITDALGMGAVHARWGFDVAPAMAIGAGADAVLVTQGDAVETLHDGIVAAVKDGRLDEDRLDDAVRHVLTLQGQDPTGIVCNARPT